LIQSLVLFLNIYLNITNRLNLGGNSMALNRRDFLKSAAAASAASAVGIAVPSNLEASSNEAQKDWRWDKAACRFCGTGCGIMLATKVERLLQ
jgi:nitrate reductase NapA